MRHLIKTIGLLVLAGCVGGSDPPHSIVPTHGVIGVEPIQLTAEYWIGRARCIGSVVFDRGAIAAQNARLEQVDPTGARSREIPVALSARRSSDVDRGVVQASDDATLR